jgi:predicted phage tail protein
MAIRKIILAGELGKKYGRIHRLDIRTPAEAIRALCANFKDFGSHLIDSEKRGVGYRVIVDKSDVSEVGEIGNPFSRTFKIVPVFMGAKSALFSIILGVALIAGAFITPLAVVGEAGTTLSMGSTAFSIAGFAVSYASIATFGAIMVLGGVAQLLSPHPKRFKQRGKSGFVCI